MGDEVQRVRGAIAQAEMAATAGDLQGAIAVLEKACSGSSTIPRHSGIYTTLMRGLRVLRACRTIPEATREQAISITVQADVQSKLRLTTKRQTQPDPKALRLWLEQSARQIDVLVQMHLTREQGNLLFVKPCLNPLEIAMQARLHAAALHLVEMLDTTWVTPYASEQDGLYQEMLYVSVCNAIEAGTRREFLDRVHRRVCKAKSYVDPTISVRWQPAAMLTVLAEYQHRIGNEDEADRLFNEVQRIVTEHPEVFEEMPPFKTFCRSWIARHEARKLMAEQRWEEAHQKMEEAIQGAFVAGHCYVSKGLVVERMLRLEAEILDQLRRHDQARGNREHAAEIAAHAAMLKRELGPLIEDILRTIEEDIAADKRQTESGQ